MSVLLILTFAGPLCTLLTLHLRPGSQKRVNHHNTCDGLSNLPTLFVDGIRKMTNAGQNNKLEIYFPVKYTCYKNIIVSALNCKEIMEDISHRFVEV